MNKHCHGTFASRAKLYRCLYDGSITRAPKMPKTCPRCNRPVAGKVTKAKVLYKVESVVSLQIPGYPWQEFDRGNEQHGEVRKNND